MLIKSTHQNARLNDNNKNALSKGPLLDIALHHVDFMCRRSEVFNSEVLCGFARKELPENLLRPLLVLPAGSCVPAVQTVELMENK